MKHVTCTRLLNLTEDVHEQEPVKNEEAADQFVTTASVLRLQYKSTQISRNGDNAACGQNESGERSENEATNVAEKKDVLTVIDLCGDDVHDVKTLTNVGLADEEKKTDEAEKDGDEDEGEEEDDEEIQKCDNYHCPGCPYDSAPPASEVESLEVGPAGDLKFKRKRSSSETEWRDSNSDSEFSDDGVHEGTARKRAVVE